MTRHSLDIEEHEVNGPFSSIDAVANVGFDALTSMAKIGMAFWSDHTKLGYYSLQEIMPHHSASTSWYYETPLVNEQTCVNYGRVRIYKYGQRYVVKDSFTKEMYLAFDMRTAMEIAVMVVHFYPNERVVPDMPDMRIPILGKSYPTQADYGMTSSGEITTIYVDSDRAPISTKVSVDINLADAVSIINGDKPSKEFLANLCSRFPTAMISAYGAPLVVYNTSTTLIGVAQSIASLGLANKILSYEAIDSFVKDKMVGSTKIVGGWGYSYLEAAGNERDRVALVDLALSQSSSPAMLEIHIANLSF